MNRQPVEPEAPQDKVLVDLNKAILDHLEASGHSKIAQLYKEELSKPQASKRHRSHSSSGGSRDRNSAKARKDAIYGKMTP